MFKVSSNVDSLSTSGSSKGEFSQSKLKRLAKEAAPEGTILSVIRNPDKEKRQLEKAIAAQYPDDRDMGRNVAEFAGWSGQHSYSKGSLCAVVLPGFDGRAALEKELNKFALDPKLPSGFFNADPDTIKYSVPFLVRHEADHCNDIPPADLPDKREIFEALADAKATLLGLRDIVGKPDEQRFRKLAIETAAQRESNHDVEYSLCSPAIRLCLEIPPDELKGASPKQISSLAEKVVRESFNKKPNSNAGSRISE